MNNNFNIEKFKQWHQDFPEEITALEEWQRDAEKRRERLTLKNTPLSIGVMGQVKAGKSSFLNSLLFEGKSLLPEAATPKTANLTRIRYAETASFTAKFYKPEDWKKIEDLANSDAQDDAARAARELVQSAKSSGENIQQLLAQGSINFQATSIIELMGKLDTYVGGEGRLTSLVAETELALPLEELIGIEIVDTPGMNDPVVSRTAKTREYMAQCDVVFFLTRSSQFLDVNDQTLLTQQLPQKGIKRLVLVGAQFDMAILDDGFNRKDLASCQSRLVERLTRLSKDTFDRLANEREQQGYEGVAQLLRGIGNPIFASTHAWIIAERDEADWNKGVKHTHKELCELAKDCWNTELSKADFKALANNGALLEAYAVSKADKEKILEEQRVNTEKELTAALNDALGRLKELAEERIHALQSNDLASLTEREKAEQAQLDKVSNALSGYLHEAVGQTKKRCTEIKQDLNQNAQRASGVDERTGYDTEKHTYKVSDSVLYKPWTWFSSHTESYTTTTSYSYIAVSDAVENLRFYVQNTQRQLLAAFDDLISPSTISAGLRRELLRVIDVSSSDFDPKAFRTLIESSLANLRLPELHFETPDIDGVFSGFSGEIKSQSDMDKLRSLLTRAVSNLNNDLANKLEDAVQEVSNALDDIADQLYQRLTERLAEELQQLREAMAEKEQNIAHMQELLKAIKA